uniref:Rhodanese domain protein n=1 Tax=Nitratidesulfovibrio vulgaris (strain DSM 19637 / Miyazaki F) TaxID=883 RepID=B8DPU5_NITV9
MVRSITPRELDDVLCGEERMLLLDVRSRSERDLHPEAIPGSQWRDPAMADTWLPSIPEGTSAVVYCAGGGEASRGIQSRLTARGVTARYLEGGLAAWQRQHGGEHGEQGGPAVRAGEGCAHAPLRGEPGGHIPAGGESGLHRPAGNVQLPMGTSEAGGHEHARGGRPGATGGTAGRGSGEGGGVR